MKISSALFVWRLHSESNWDRFELSMHAKGMHQSQFSLNNISVALVKKFPIAVKEGRISVKSFKVFLFYHNRKDCQINLEELCVLLQRLVI